MTRKTIHRIRHYLSELDCGMLYNVESKAISEIRKKVKSEIDKVQSNVWNNIRGRVMYELRITMGGENE